MLMGFANLYDVALRIDTWHAKYGLPVQQWEDALLNRSYPNLASAVFEPHLGLFV